MVERAGLGPGDRRLLLGGPHRLRAALQQEDPRPRWAVARDGPLDVLRAAVVLLDLAAQPGQRADLLVVEAGLVLQVRGHVLLPHPRAGRVHAVLAELARHRAAEDLAGHLVDRVAVRGDGPADQRRAEAPAGFQHDHGAVPGERAAGEHHTRAARIDHALDDHRHRPPLLGQAPAPAIGQRLNAVQARPAPPDRVAHLVLAADPQVAVLHAGEAGVGAVLARGARPDGHWGRAIRCVALAVQRAVVPDDRVADRIGQR